MAQKVTGKDLKELRRPDEFQVVAGRVLEWILAHQRPILLGAGAIVALLLLAWGATLYKGHRETNAGEALAEALRIGNRPVAGEGMAQPGEETFPSKAERSKAASEALEKVRKEHAGSVAAQTATLELGLLKQHGGESDAAIALLQEFIRGVPSGHPMRAIALEALGYAQEAKGSLAEARDSFARLKDAGAEARSAYQLARLSLVEGKPDAKAQLEAVAKDHPKDPVAIEANLRVEVASLPPPPSKPAAPAEEKPAEPKKAPKAPAKKKGK